MKKLFLLLVFITFTAIVFGCSNNKAEINSYKTEAVTVIKSYADGKGKGNYSDDNWIMICKVVDDSKKGIELSKNKQEVDAAVGTAKILIDQACGEIDDMSIQLSEGLRLEILNLYQSWALSEFGHDYPFKGIEYFIYYGKYNEFYVIIFTGWYFLFRQDDIDGLDFSHPGAGEIYAINDDFGGTLKEAYEEGYLTRSELEEINKIHDGIFNSEDGKLKK